MNAKLKTFAVAACAAVCALTLPACSAGRSTQLGKPATVNSLSYGEMIDDGFTAFKGKADKFASVFAPSAYKTSANAENFAVSPISVFMALALASECSGGETRTEILNALDLTHEQMRAYIPDLYRSLNKEYKRGIKATSTLDIGNSIWVNEGMRVKQDCIDALSNYYYSYSYSADFENDNENANKAVRGFVKDRTNGLIDNDFKLSKETLFALINTMYLKSVWNSDGDDLPFAGQYKFEQNDGSVKDVNLLQGYYSMGRAYGGETYSTFYTSTCDGYMIKFIVPNDGYRIDDVFTAETLSEVNSITDYQDTDDVNKVHYFTRCLFPEYKSSYDGDITEVLKSSFGLNLLFDSDNCDYSSLTDEGAYCREVKHVTNLTVNKLGIEGAAVTVLINGPTSAGPSEYETVYEDFVVDKSFGFIITDYQNVTLFSGVVNKV